MEKKEQQSFLERIPMMWKVLATILSAMAVGSMWTQRVDRVLAAPQLAEETAAHLKEVAEIVHAHDTAIEMRGGVIQATYDLARANASNLSILLCMHQAEIESTDVRSCLLARSGAREQ